MSSPTDTPLSVNVPDAAPASTIITTFSIITLGQDVIRRFEAGFEPSEDLNINFNESSVDPTNGSASTTSLATVATSTTYASDTTSTAPSTSARRVHDGGTGPGAAMAITGLLFVPTLFLTLGATVMTHGTSTDSINYIANGPPTSILLVTLICEVVAATVEACSTAFPIASETELEDASSAVDWGECLRLISRCLAVLSVILFLVGVGASVLV